MNVLNGQTLTANQLKWIALATMTLDHAGKVFADCWLPLLATALQVSEYAAYLVYTAVFSVGRVTIYIFLWLIAEGCRHTRDIRAYIGRLALFGLVAEIPFQWMIQAIMGEPLSVRLGFTNVMFTLALGALACHAYQLLKEKGYGALCFAPPAALAALAYWLHTDYDAFGVLCIFLLYVTEDRKKRLGVLALLILLFIGVKDPLVDIVTYGFSPYVLPVYAINLLYALLSVAVLSAYHGSRGNRPRLGNYFFYAYYPAHIALLMLFYVWLGR